MDEVAFTLFGRPVAWYGILITCGMILAVLYALHICKFEGISSDDIIDFAFVVIVCGVLGARLYYVIFKWDSYVVTDAQNFLMNIWETLKNVVAVWEGGLAIYGGIIAGILTALVYARKRKLKFIKLLDILAPCVWIGQVIGRWGNFINMEAYGGETTLPWRMGLLYSYLDNGVWDVEKYVHPTFLYKSLWNLTALVLVLIFYKKKKFDGQICSIYFMWYGFGRMLIEGLRTDSLMLGNLRISQGVGFVSLILGIVLTIVFVKKHQSSKAAEDTDYTPVYADLNKDTPDQTEKSTEE
ncbi:MAG: prolipoprotein diacylglyceryl transferase [Clostridia bacterium]|nr:prolipoprotein diacylglyceryl transferase [Clostridia bacterium]